VDLPLASGDDVVTAEPSSLGVPVPAPRRRRRTVLYATLAVALIVATLIGVIASSQPSSQVASRTPLLGRAAPPVSGPSIGGPRPHGAVAVGRYSLSQFRREWVLVNFMATWCPPCQAEMPQLLRFSRQHAKSEDATVLTVAYDPSDVSALRKYLSARGADWPAVDDPAASVPYGVTGLPSSFLVAPGGIVYAYVVGAVTAGELDQWVKQGTAKGLVAGGTR
jgi:thiol-disulfide isomerase/thioredoxin